MEEYNFFNMNYDNFKLRSTLFFTWLLVMLDDICYSKTFGKTFIIVFNKYKLETNQIQTFGKSPEPNLKPWKIIMVMITINMVYGLRFMNLKMSINFECHNEYKKKLFYNLIIQIL
jgi:hypothetical protein